MATRKTSCRALLQEGKCESFGPKDSSDNDYDDKNYGRDYGELFLSANKTHVKLYTYLQRKERCHREGKLTVVQERQ